MTFNTGIGMKYELTKTLTKVRHRNIKLNVNMAPFSYNYMYSTQKGTDMDLKRHGLKRKTMPPNFLTMLTNTGTPKAKLVRNSKQT